MLLRMTPDAIERRKSRIREISLRDVNRFKPNPLGPGYLTRDERYRSLIWSLELRRQDPRDPDWSRQGIFVHHNCWKCKDGALVCANGNQSGCEYPHARND